MSALDARATCMDGEDPLAMQRAQCLAQRGPSHVAPGIAHVASRGDPLHPCTWLAHPERTWKEIGECQEVGPFVVLRTGLSHHLAQHGLDSAVVRATPNSPHPTCHREMQCRETEIHSP